jgi:hypothetical protein
MSGAEGFRPGGVGGAMSGPEGFRPDRAAIAAARAALEAALATNDDGAWGEGFEAAGRLVALGAPAVAAEALAKRGDLRAVAAKELDRDEAADALEDAAVVLRQRLAELEDGAKRAAVAADVGAALAERDRAEFRLLGAALALGLEPDWVAAGVAGRLEFEALVRPELFRLCAFNPERRAALASVAPPLRARFWWQHEGADLDAGAVAALPAVAALVAAFPAAGAQFASLVRAREAWSLSHDRATPAGSLARAARAEAHARAARVESHNRATHAGGPPAPPEGSPVPGGEAAGRVYTLRDWVERRARRGGAHADEALPLAAAPDDEVPLVDEADYQLSWAPPAELIVDLVADRRPGELPSLRLADGSIVRGYAVEGAEERFAFVLPERAFGEARVWLTLPFVKGGLELGLPPGGEGDG